MPLNQAERETLQKLKDENEPIGGMMVYLEGSSRMPTYEVPIEA